MRSDNLTFLQENLRYLGFGEAIIFNENLEREIRNGVSEFQLKTEARFDEWTRIEAKLYFRKSDSLDMYFFNKYDAFLMYDDDPRHNKMQTFYVSKGRGVTFKEAFNLLQGRAVYKNLTDPDGAKYNAWIQLSFSERTTNLTNYKTRHFGEKYGYDLEKTLANYPIRELQDETLKANLIYSLKKGNAHPVTFLKASKIEKMYIEACPAFKTIVIYSDVTRAAQRQSLPKEHSIKIGASILSADPETPSGNGEKEEGKNEEQEPPAATLVSANGSMAKKRGRRPDSL